MTRLPDGFTIFAERGLVIVTWTDAEGETMTAAMPPFQAAALSEELDRNAELAERDGGELRLRDIAARQMRSSGSIRLRPAGRRAA